MRAKQWRQGMRDGIPICLGYLAVSFTFGIVAKNGGLSALQAAAMSAGNLASAGQFAGLGLIAAGASLAETLLTMLVVNLRYSLMSCSLSQKLPEDTPFYHRMLMSVGITDEIYGVSALKPGALSPFYTYGLMAAAVPGWVAGTVLGVLLGSVMPGRLLQAFSIALYGMFIAVIVPPARKNKLLLGVIVLSMGASAVFAVAPVLREISSGFKIILLTVLIAGGAALLFPVEETEGGETAGAQAAPKAGAEKGGDGA